jgi:hypothetical protein
MLYSARVAEPEALLRPLDPGSPRKYRDRKPAKVGAPAHWHPQPTLNEVIAAQVQSLARTISATTDLGHSLTEVKNGLDALLAESHKNSN